MKFVEIAREAYRNVETGTARAIWVALGTGLIATALVVSNVAAVASIAARAEAFRASGATTYVASSEHRISGALCDALGSLNGVASSGAVRPATDKMRFNNLPSQTFESYEATSGLARVLLSDPSVQTGAPLLVLDERLAARVGVQPGDVFKTNQGAAYLGATYSYPEDGRVQLLGNAAILMAPSQGMYDQCWMTLSATQLNGRELISRSVVPGGVSDQLQVLQLNTKLGASFSAEAAFEERPTRLAPLAALILSAMLATPLAARRRIEFSNARHFGVTRAQLVLQVTGESMIWAIPIVALLLPATLVLTRLLTNVSTMVTAETVQTVVAAIIGSSVASAAIAASASERTLFRAVKAR